MNFKLGDEVSIAFHGRITRSEFGYKGTELYRIESKTDKGDIVYALVSEAQFCPIQTPVEQCPKCLSSNIITNSGLDKDGEATWETRCGICGHIITVD